MKDLLLEDWFIIEEKIAPPQTDKSVITDGFLCFTVLVKFTKNCSEVELMKIL